jgi:hypothetical protein
METVEGKVFVEKVRAGSGYDIQDQAFARLGGDLGAQFDSLSTSGQIRQFIEANKDQLKPEELKEFKGYADYIGLLFGFQDEAEEPKQ